MCEEIYTGNLRTLVLRNSRKGGSFCYRCIRLPSVSLALYICIQTKAPYFFARIMSAKTASCCAETLQLMVRVLPESYVNFFFPSSLDGLELYPCVEAKIILLIFCWQVCWSFFLSLPPSLSISLSLFLLKARVYYILWVISLTIFNLSDGFCERFQCGNSETHSPVGGYFFVFM